MEKIKELYETYKIYVTRENIERLSLGIIVLSALWVFLSSIPFGGVLTLDKGAIRYDGSIVRGKMNGQGTVTFENGDTYKGNFVNGQPEGQGTLTTEQNVVYKGTFKQGIYQNAN